MRFKRRRVSDREITEGLERALGIGHYYQKKGHWFKDGHYPIFGVILKRIGIPAIAILAFFSWFLWKQNLLWNEGFLIFFVFFFVLVFHLWFPIFIYLGKRFELEFRIDEHFFHIPPRLISAYWGGAPISLEQIINVKYEAKHLVIEKERNSVLIPVSEFLAELILYRFESIGIKTERIKVTPRGAIKTVFIVLLSCLIFFGAFFLYFLYS